MIHQLFGNKKADERKYAYEKAIDAYWNHVSRYHIWMNYYSIFNGAIFVGFCTILTATTKILNSEDQKIICQLENDYSCLLVALCLIGLFSSISWKSSLIGHKMWMVNWMNIIEYYEDEKNPIYKLLIVDSSFIKPPLSDDLNEQKLSKGSKFSKSTTIITNRFINSIIIGWILLLIYSNYLLINYLELFFNCLLVCTVLIFLMVFILIVISVSFVLYEDVGSDVSGKIWKKKQD